MPELPEVETIRRGLEPRVVGRRIRNVLARECRVLQVSVKTLKSRTRRQSICGLERRGKFLIFELERAHLIFHLGMTGQLTFRDPDRSDCKNFRRHPVTGLERAAQHAPDRHTHIQIELEEGGAVLYRDVRKFGRVVLLSRAGSPSLETFLAKLGLEPFGEQYQWEAFAQGMRHRRRRLKSLLLDQGFVAGIGNIYADEALFEAGLHPARTVRSLRRVEKGALFDAIPRVLRRGIDHGGTTLRDYVNSQGAAGSHQEELNVYGRQGEPCRRCGHPLHKMVLSQRGTHFCPRCQPRRPPPLARRAH